MRCGRTHRRIDRIKARTDDMLIINGVNVFPSQIEEALMKMPEMGTNYQIVVDKKESLDRVTIKTEVNSGLFKDDMRDLEALRSASADNIKSADPHQPGHRTPRAGHASGLRRKSQTGVRQPACPVNAHLVNIFI